MMQSYLIVGAKSNALPVPLADLKAHLPVFGSNDDTRLTALEWAAVDWIERQTNRYLVTTTVTEVFERFPTVWERQAGGNMMTPWNPYPFTNSAIGMPYNWGRWQRVELSRSPVQSITSLTYFDSNNVQQTLLPTTDYWSVLPTDRPAFIQPVKVWPLAYYRPDAVSLTYTAGYSVLPGALNAAIKLLVGAFNENREDYVIGNGQLSQVPIGVQALIESVQTGGYW